MQKKEKRLGGNGILRVVFVGISLLVQVGWILVRVQWLNDYSERISFLSGMLALAVVLKLNAKPTNAAMKMPWIMLILAFPLMGLTLYLLMEILGDPGVGRRLQAMRKEMAMDAPERAKRTLAHMEARDISAANQCRYLWNQAGYPAYENTQLRYYPEAKEAFADLKKDLETARHFIFMEYFIVEEGSAFEELEQILARKAAEGVEVRLMYDDLGSVGTVNRGFVKRLNAEGIRCRPFNPALPVLNLFVNHRDHRKITVIDGKIGFTGGYNLADEYFDRRRPYGKWKDTGLRLEGEAVQSLTTIFLELWNLPARQKETTEIYRNIYHGVPASGFVQPYADNPLGRERIAENVYLNLINRAQKSLYIMTPYLIITDEMSHALGLAAMRGVDVRIITPGIPDKKTVYAVTRSYYAGLVRQGVRIFEYSPGFCHAKQCICDGEMVSIGTSNLDYRSLYHHFENNVLLWGCDAVKDIAVDFELTLEQCREVTADYAEGRGAMLRAWQYILRLFAPLM